MFDAKSLIEMMVRGAAPQRPNTSEAGAGGLNDLLGQLGRMLPQQGGAQADGGRAAQGNGGNPGGISGGIPGLDDLLRQIAGGAGQQPQSGGRNMAERGDAPASGGGGLGGGGLGDIMGQMRAQMEQAGRALGQGGRGDTAPSAGPARSAAAGGANIMDILGQVLAQATSGAKDGAGRIGAATGANDALGRMTGGASMEDMMATLKTMIERNQFGAGAAAGGLGAVVLGTQTGRSIAAGAAKIGALALIGGLAYKAYQNYQAGKPLIALDHVVAEAAPDGSGFEPDSVTNEAAILYIRAMIAAASADGRVDPAEMTGIMGNLKQAGFEAAAEEFLADELNNPATIDSLVESCVSAEQGVQVYTAARIAISPDSRAEQAFLAELAAKLGMAPELAANIDAATRNHA
ncbi:MAG: DUF533 domain-containing protein [Hyphomicrobium aestuarii]|nr:DUF533 domain-containing protein [Hyphomicrobium aestuarii]